MENEIRVEDRVCLKNDPTLVGTVVDIDHETFDATTALVQWDGSGADDLDVQWTNRLIPVNG